MSRESRAERRRRERAAARTGATAQQDAVPAADGPEGQPGDDHGRVAWWRILSVAALFALVFGFLEGALIHHVVSLGVPLRVSRDYLWMAPVSYLLVLVTVALLLLGVGRLWRPAARLPVAVGIFAGLASYSVLLALEWLHPLATLLLAAGVGAQLGRMARGRFGGMIRRFAPLGAVALGVLLAGVALYFVSAEDRREALAHEALPAASSGPNILLIILDTVRAASLGLYDAAKSNTPNLDRFARGGVVFDHAYAPSPWTLPSHATLFTGLWPHEHGADWKRPLDARFTTLAEVLAQEGYATAGFVGNLTWGSHNWGLDQGFARYEDYPVSVGQIVLSSGLGRRLASVDRLRAAVGLHHVLNRVPATAVTDRFLRWQERHGASATAGSADRPFFAFLNYFDAHEPLPSLLEPEPIVPVEHRNGLLTGAVAHFVNRPGVSERRFLDEYRRAYEATIGELDRELGRLFLELERRGVLDETLVIVTSDHGEMIGEQNLFGHNSSLYLPTLHVPLLIRYPERVPTGARVAEQVSLRSIPATVLELAGATGADAALPGKSVIASAPGAAVDERRADTVFAHLTRGQDSRIPPWAPAARGPEMASVIEQGFQYIRNGDGSEELYALRVDREQRRNLAGGAAVEPVVAPLRALLRSVRLGEGN